MQFFSDILDFIKTLTFIDYVFFFAIVILLVLIITLIYFIKSNKEVFEEENENPDDLKAITNQLANSHPKIEFTSYEKDQEEKAIISYDELLKKSKLSQLNYDEETNLDGLSIKKISFDETPIIEKEPSQTPNVRVISYQNEEKFLAALKELQSLLS